MNRALIAGLCAAFALTWAGSAAAEKYATVGYNDDSVSLIEIASIKRTKGGGEAWVLTVHEADRTIAGIRFRFSRSIWKADCDKRMINSDRIDVYDAKFKLLSTQTIGDFSRVPKPGSTGETMLMAICGEADPPQDALVEAEPLDLLDYAQEFLAARRDESRDKT